MKKLLFALLLSMMTMSAADTRVFELRTYHTKEGRLDALLARFRDHTTTIFDRHHITNIGYWIPEGQPNTLIYIVSHPSMEDAKKNWDAFRDDPEWKKVKSDSEAAGPIVEKVDSVYMKPTDFSKLN